MNIINNFDYEIFKKRLNIFNDDYVSILKKVIQVNQKYMLDDLFYKYFYVDNEEIRKIERDFIDSLYDDCQIKIIHGHSKNGKTTFINHIIYKIRRDKKLLRNGYDDIVLIPFDYENGEIGNYRNKMEGDFQNRFMKVLLEDRLKLNEEVQIFNKFIFNFYNELIKEGLINQANYLEKNVFKIIFAFNRYLENTNYGNNGNTELILKNFKKYVINSITNNNCAYYFVYYVLFEVFNRRGDFLKGKICKYIFTLDNIDDYLENKDILFLEQPQIKLSSFLFLFSENPFISGVFVKSILKTINSKENNLHFSFKDQIIVVYILRTANFLVFANLINKQYIKASGSQEIHFADLLIEKKNYFYKTEPNTSKILNQRLDIFQEITERMKIDIPYGFTFLKSLSDNFDTDTTDKEENDIRRIYNLWNGDKSAFWNSITKNWGLIEKKYLKYENIIKILNDNEKIRYSIKTYLFKGVCLNLFLFLLRKNKTLEDLLRNSIDCFMDPENGQMKNINRMVLNYIVNETIESGWPECIKNIESKGVGFYELLEKVDEFIEKINCKCNMKEIIYKNSQVDEFIEKLFTTKIDHFANPFVIYKDQIKIVNNIKVNSNYYELKKELQRYRKEKKDPKCKEELNKIRIFSNNNAAYISLSLLSNYELYSHLVSDDLHNYNLPLLFLLTKDENAGTITKEVDLPFYNVITNVFAKVEEIVTNMVDFYIKYLGEFYDPDEFIEDSFFTVLLNDDENKKDGNKRDGLHIKEKKKKGNFQYNLIISRHITYLQDFRQVVLNYKDNNWNLNLDEKIIANLFLTKTILKYCMLFIKSYYKIDNEIKIGEKNILRDSLGTFNKFKNKAKEIIEKNNSDFTIIE